MVVIRIGVLVKSCTKSMGGTPPRARYRDGPKTSRRIARLKRGGIKPSLYIVVKIGLYCSRAGLCGPCHVVRRHVIRDVHKYCDAYVLHSQGSFYTPTIQSLPYLDSKSSLSPLQYTICSPAAVLSAEGSVPAYTLVLPPIS